MRDLLRMKVCRWVVVLGFALLCAGCASAPAVKQEEASPVPVSPATREPATAGPVVPAPSVELREAPPSEKELAKEVSCLVHTVQWRGETLSMIAAWYTGKSTNWKALAEANPNIKPNLIAQGDTIRIPEDMVRRRDPMPKRYVEKFYKSGKDQASSKAAPSQPREDAPTLFGPKAPSGK